MQTYAERNLGCAAFLVTRGFRFTELIKLGKGYHGFCFADPSGECIAAAREYLHGGQCAAEVLIANLHRLKQILREAANEKGTYKNESQQSSSVRPRP